MHDGYRVLPACASSSKETRVCRASYYANCFIPFMLEEFQEIDILVLRYTNQRLGGIIEAGGYTDIKIIVFYLYFRAIIFHYGLLAEAGIRSGYGAQWDCRSYLAKPDGDSGIITVYFGRYGFYRMAVRLLFLTAESAWKRLSFYMEICE